MRTHQKNVLEKNPENEKAMLKSDSALVSFLFVRETSVVSVPFEPLDSKPRVARYGQEGKFARR